MTEPPSWTAEEDLRRTGLERALRHDRMTVTLSAGALAALAWTWIVAMGLDMYRGMDGASAWAMTLRWGRVETALLLAMWIVMMVAMMTPAAIPVLLIYGGVVRSSADAPAAPRRVWLLAAGYFTAWGAFSAGATVLQRLLSSIAIVTPMMEVGDRRAAGTLLVLAGAYQLTPAKRSCLRLCRSAAAIVAECWRPGDGGAFSMGVRHGLHCLGCCWALMLLLFVGGVMNLYAIGAITLVVLVEKLGPGETYVSSALGFLLVAAGLWTMLG